MTELLHRRDVLRITGLSRSTVDRLERAGRFPRRVQLSPRRVAWPAESVAAWASSRPTVGGTAAA
jgi:prophage regulatory protein